MRKIYLLLALLLILPAVSATATINSNGIVFTATDAASPSGMKILALYNVTILNVTMNGSATHGAVTINNATATHEVLKTCAVSGTNAVCNFNITAGVSYYIMGSGGGDRSYKSSGVSYPYANPKINWTAGVTEAWAETSTIAFSFQNVITEDNFPSVNLNIPSNNSITISNNLSITDNGLGTFTNTTFYLWNSTSLVNTAYTTLKSSNITIPRAGNYKWNAYSCYGDSCAFSTNGNFSFYYGTQNISESYATTNYETAVNAFSLVVNSTAVPSANLYYNGTTYSVGVSSLGGGYYNLTYSFDIPEGAGTKNFWWEIFNSGTSVNTTAKTQIIASTLFNICNSSINVPYYNITFKNETISQEVVSSALSSTFTYYLSTGNGAVTKSYTLANTTANLNYGFCTTPQHLSLKVTPTILYYNSYSPQRSYAPGELTLTNSTTATTLYLLPSSEGSYTTFQILSASNSPIPGATVTLSRSGIGDIESKITDSSGTATFFVNPLVSYTVTASATGFGSSTSSITPTQTSYTITIGTSTSSINITDSARGVSYFIFPSGNQLDRWKIYNFNFTINSSYTPLTSYGYYLRDMFGNIINSTSGTTAGGSTISSVLNITTNQTIKMDYYWVINGTLVNGTKTWTIFPTLSDDWSIKNLFNRFNTYVSNSSDDDGLFGLKKDVGNNFNLAIVAFFIIFIFTGVMSYKFGIDNPGVIVGLLAAATIFFDGVLGWFPAISPIPSIIMFILAVGMFIREATVY